MQQRTSIVRNIGYTLGRQLFVAFISLVNILIIARVLGPEGNGQYAITVLIPTLILTALDLGIPAANVYFLGRGEVSLRVATLSCYRMWVVLALLGVIAGVFFVLSYADSLLPGISLQLAIIGLASFPLALLKNYLISLLHGLQQFRSYNFALWFPPIATLLLLVIAVVLLRTGVHGAVLAFTGGQLSGLAVAYALVRRHRQSTVAPNLTAREYPKHCLSYGWKAYLGNMLAFLNNRSDIFLINYFIDPAATGIYAVSVQLAERLLMISQSVSTVILPRLAQEFKSDPSANQLTPIVARWVLVLTATGALTFALVAYPLILVLFGREYLASLIPFFILLPGIVLGSFSRVLANDIAARGRPEVNMYFSAGALIINIAGNIALIPTFGVIGAAIATCFAYTLTTVARWTSYLRLSKLSWRDMVVVTDLERTTFRRIFLNVLLVIKRKTNK